METATFSDATKACPLISVPLVIAVSADPEMLKHMRSIHSACVGEWLEARGGARALELHESAASEGRVVSLLLDRTLPDLDSLEVAQLATRLLPHTSIRFVENYDTAGCSGTDKSVECARSLRPISSHPERVTKNPEGALPGMIGESEAMQRVYRMVRLVAGRETTVLITGETGTGKELIARALHMKSNRSRGPFISVNCSAIPDTLLESELFGYSKGAFTGATQASIGRIKAAEGGTIFLDEIGELSPTMQSKLLRFLQEGEVQRLGEVKSSRVDVRVVAATNADLTDRSMGRSGGFRQDLYYRLAVFPIELPRLRERGSDAVLLARYFLRKHGTREQVLSRDAELAIAQYCWPGNVRELQHAIERAVIMAQEDAVITRAHIDLPISQLSIF